MQLNSTTDHSIVVVRNAAKGITFDRYANDLRQNPSGDWIDWQLPEETVLEGGITLADFLTKKAYSHLLTMPELSGYVESEGKNWKQPDCPIRLIVDKRKLTADMLAGNPIGGLVQYCLSNETIKAQTVDQPESDSLYIYLRFILPEHQAAIDASSTIVVEYQ